MTNNPTHHSAGHGATTHAQPGDAPVLKPFEPAVQSGETNPAVDLIRQKLAAIYSEEPDAKAEIAETAASLPPRSKHQQYMFELTNSGKNLAQVQTAWHQYYIGLPDDEKRAVWEEFYSNNAQGQTSSHTPTTSSPIASHNTSASPTTALPTVTASSLAVDNPTFNLGQIYPTATLDTDSKPLNKKNEPVSSPTQTAHTAPASNTVAVPLTTPVTADGLRHKLRGKVGKRATLQAKHHLQSLAFGLGFGALVLLVILFSFFNEVVIAPFVQPSRQASATPIIIGNNGLAPNGKDEVIIPKINLEIPLDFSSQTIDEKEIEKGLDNGVVHYPTTALPGQAGNTAFFGHSSNNIFNPGKYKFAFVLLHELVEGDTFYLSYKGTLYAYTVYDKQVVDPSNVSVLNPVESKKATAVLITCDPPGTSLKRLVVWGEQISPDPNGNAVAEPTPTKSGAQQSLPGNGPTLWRRMWNGITGN